MERFKIIIALGGSHMEIIMIYFVIKQSQVKWNETKVEKV